VKCTGEGSTKGPKSASGVRQIKPARLTRQGKGARTPEERSCRKRKGKDEESPEIFFSKEREDKSELEARERTFKVERLGGGIGP